MGQVPLLGPPGDHLAREILAKSLQLSLLGR
jgi:hypothetical protein